MKILLSKEAEFDLLEAEDWYNQQRVNLGLELREAFDQKLDQISENATHFQLRYRSVRVAFLTRFPYGIHFFQEAETLYVVGFFHMKRKPRHWEN